ncbi:GNAT family N-acetyltransferase [Arthrobacter sp. zg-ZUI100]|uniref:GNAT family N-acetyltransferase n=1 Tax=Arthrobacter jiangjiafuii TaxID=2817475 RepID=UPI001AEF114E|nr:GNAT family N-acetyltransferase [Arthrobacter jiangjiafuii]MBP3035727.1 GNAT family N-acetyltransferase [Arthrobacter jiangjiafuii]
MIREGTPRDIPAIAGLRAAWAGEQQGVQVSVGMQYREAFGTWLQANPRTFFVAEDAAAGPGSTEPPLVGMLNLSIFERMPKPGKPASVWVYLSNAYVLPAHRNAGVGTELVSAAIRHARLLGAARIVTSPSPASKSFYARNGFEPAEELAVYRF